MTQMPPAATPMPKPQGLNSPWVKQFLKYVGKGHVALYRATGGRLGGKFRMGAAFRKPVPVALLTHIGRKSKRELTSPLLYLRDGNRVILVASSGGMDQTPQWYRNLQAEPRVIVQTGSRVEPMIARTASPEEKADYWPRLVNLYADFDNYQSWTTREIPVVICEPHRP